MRCPFCRQDNDKVVDTRTSDDGFVVRRRRTCCACGKRFTTYERVETTQVRVIKRNGQRVPYDRVRLRQGLEKACWKRQISDAQISTLIAQVESDIDSMFETEVESQFIGERVMQYLGELDQVAFVRFASVYRQFQDASDFAKDLGEMLEDPDDIPFTLKHLPRPKKLRFPKTNKKRIQ